jgi:trigger factor
MKHTRINTSPSRVKLTVALDGADLASVKAKTIARLSKNLKVPGFRPGKIPASVAEKQLAGNSFTMELAEDAINHFMLQVLETEKLQPLDKPSLSVTKHVPSELLEFSVELDVLPPIKLGDYTKLTVKKEPVKVTAKDIEAVIQRMRTGMSTKTEVKRAAKEDDEVVINFAGTKDGKEVTGASGKDYPLALGSKTFIPGFEEGLVGKKTGDTFDLPLTFPKDYQHKPLAGQKVTFAVTVKNVKAVELPKIDDAFAAKCGPFKNIDELKADIKRELTEQQKRESEDKLKDHLVEQLVKKSDVPTPEILITDQIANLERDFTQNLLYRGMTLQQYLDDQKLTKDQWRETELRSQAIRRVQAGLVLAELSKAENISATMDELNERLASLLQQYGSDPKIREQLDTPEVRRDIANRLITEKTVDRLVELNS